MTAQTTTERQAAYRARKAAAKLQEVRGVFLPAHLHADLKQFAAKLAKRKTVGASAQVPSEGKT